MSTIARNELDKELSELKRKFESHVRAYISNAVSDLEAHVEAIVSDYEVMDNNGKPAGKIEIDINDLKRTFITGKHAFKDTLEAFFDDSVPDNEFSSEYDLEGQLDQIGEDMENHLRQDDSEEMETTYTTLRKSVMRYNLGVKSEQETILRILEDEFYLSLVCL